MESDLSSLFVKLAAQMRVDLSSLYLAAAQLAPPEAREKNLHVDHAAAVLEQSYYRLLRLTTSLSAAEIMNSTVAPSKQDVDLVELIRNLCDSAASLVACKGISLHFICDMEHHVCSIVPVAMEQALYHLLSNAVKFTSAGGVITVELRKDGEYLLLSVADTGCGIPANRLEALFCRYAEPAERQDPPPYGFGLGLAICRRVAEFHGGTLLAESKEGQGSRFTLSLVDCCTGAVLSDVPFLYTGGFNPALLGLADALPVEAFLCRNLD